MTQDYTRYLAEILREISNTQHIRPGDVPDIDLYMDQVTHFMDEHLKNTRRYENDKILTKTMINNYTKKKLLPHPTKKRYTKEHLLLLIYIYYFKDYLSLTDIRTILSPIMDSFFQKEDTISIEDIYTETYHLSADRIQAACRDIMDAWHTASNSFEDCPDDSRDTLQIFSFICMLSFDIYLRKQVIVKLLDEISEPAEDPDPESEDED